MTNIPINTTGTDRLTEAGSQADDLREETLGLTRAGSQPVHSIEISKSSIEARLKEIAAMPDVVQQREVRALALELFGSREKAIAFTEAVTEQLVRGEWETATNFNPNGFFKMGLAKMDGVALRLHFNSRTVDIPEGARVEENIHDHRWSFSSTLLTGQFKHALFKHVDPEDEGAIKLHKYSYTPRGGKEVFDMTYEGPAYLKEIATRLPKQFEPFWMSATAIHRAGYPLQDTEMTVTAVITLENRGRKFNFVFPNDEIHSQITESHGTTPTPRCDEDTQVRLLLELQKALRDGGRQ